MPFQLAIAFDGKHPEFARGYEAGAVEGRLRALPTERISEWVHADNAEMMLRIAEALQRPFQSRDLDEDWLEVVFEPSEDY
jgi:hypothetical protein